MVRRPRRSTRFPYATLFRSTASAASVTVNSATSITATVPAGAPVTSKINATTPGGTATSNSDFTLRSEEHTSELQSRQYLVCRLLLEKNIQLGQASF